MSPTEAWAIVGNQPTWAIRNMIRALTMMPALNTQEEQVRLVAARICIRNPNPRYAT